jgi:hypothetical protein
MLHIDGTARTRTAASAARCLEVLADVDRYPDWSSLITTVDRLDGGRLRLSAQVLGFSVRMTCVVDLAPDRAVMRRVPNEPGDEESYVATWSVRPEGTGTEVQLHVVAALAAPGPASIIRGRVQRALVDDLLADFAAAAHRGKS